MFKDGINRGTTLIFRQRDGLVNGYDGPARWVLLRLSEALAEAVFSSQS